MKLTAGLAPLAVHPTAKAAVGCHYAKETPHNVDSPGENRSCRSQNCCHSLCYQITACADVQQSDDALTTDQRAWSLYATKPKVTKLVDLEHAPQHSAAGVH